MNIKSITSLLTIYLPCFLVVPFPVFAERSQTYLVSVEPVKEEEIIETEAISGTLIAREEILVFPEVDGLQIEEVLVDEGDYVERGQILVRLSRDMLDIQVLKNKAVIAKALSVVEQSKNRIIQVEATLTESRQALERVQKLRSSGNSTDVQLEKAVALEQSIAGQLEAEKNGLLIAQAELQAAEAQHEELLLRLSKADIKATEAGIISRRNARLGAIASPNGDALFRIIANGDIELEGEISSLQSSVISAGMPFHMALENGDTLLGQVRLVSPEINKTTRMGRIRISLPVHPNLRVGAFARGDVEIDRKMGIIAPLTSVIYDADISSILVIEKLSTNPVDKGKTTEQLASVERKQVSIKPMNSRYVHVIEGLKPDSLVVVRAGAFIYSGDIVRINEIARPGKQTDAP